MPTSRWISERHCFKHTLPRIILTFKLLSKNALRLMIMIDIKIFFSKLKRLLEVDESKIDYMKAQDSRIAIFAELYRGICRAITINQGKVIS